MGEPQAPSPNERARRIVERLRAAAGEVNSIQSIVIARSEATKQSRTAAPHWIASLCSELRWAEST
jgi:hypothetical protein